MISKVVYNREKQYSVLLLAPALVGQLTAREQRGFFPLVGRGEISFMWLFILQLVAEPRLASLLAGWSS